MNVFEQKEVFQWGELLFYPANRVVRARTPKLSGAGIQERARATRQRIHATMVRRAPQVMVKVTGGRRLDRLGGCVRGGRVNPPVTSSEASLIEALDEMSEVLHRVETLVPALNTGQRGMTQASAKLAAQLSTVEVRIAAFAEAAKIHAAKLIAARTDEAARNAINLQLRAMQEAARTLFLKELSPALQGLVQPLQRMQEVARQSLSCEVVRHAHTLMENRVVQGKLVMTR